MADVNVTFGAVDAGLGQAIANIRAQLGGMGAGGGAAFFTQANQWNTQVTQLTQNINNFTQATTQAGSAARAAGINIGSMIERMAFRMALMFAFREIIKAIADTIKEAATTETNFMHIMDMNAETVEKTEERMDDLKKISHDTGEDLNKVVIPAFVKLRETGIMPDEAVEDTRIVNQQLELTGVNLTDIIAKVKVGTAGFVDIAKAAAGLGLPDIGRWANDWMKAEQAEKAYNREMEHTLQLTERAQHDALKLSEAHLEFAKSTGLATDAFKAFQERGARSSLFATIPRSLADLPGGYTAFSQLLGEMQRKFGEGMTQIAKEENLPMRLVKMGVTAGIEGFDEKSLLSAQKRAVEERNLAKTRAEQDERYTRTQSFEIARVNANKTIAEEMQKQVNSMAALDRMADTLSGKLKRMGNEIKETQRGIGDVAQQEFKTKPIQEDIGKTFDKAGKQQETYNYLQRQQAEQLAKTGVAGTQPATQAQMDAWMRQTEKITPTTPLENIEKTIGEGWKTVADKVEDLIRMLEGRGAAA
jgi:hypothetical protein